MVSDNDSWSLTRDVKRRTSARHPLLHARACKNNYSVENMSHSTSPNNDMSPPPLSIEDQVFCENLTSRTIYDSAAKNITRHFYDNFAPRVKSRRFIFIGDSTLLHQFQSFCGLLKGDLVPSAAGYHLCNLKALNSIAQYFAFRDTTADDRYHLSLISKKIARLEPKDIILASIGVHWPHICKELQNAVFDVEHAILNTTFEIYLYKLLALVLPSRSVEKDSSNCSALLSYRRSYPTVLFRESLPQHFPSFNGMYDANNNRHRSSECVPMTLNMYNGMSDLPCSPNCLPATWQNIVARAHLKLQCVPIIEVFNALSCGYFLHSSKGDCTHYESKAVNAFLNDRFLRKLPS